MAAAAVLVSLTAPLNVTPPVLPLVPQHVLPPLPLSEQFSIAMQIFIVAVNFV